MNQLHAASLFHWEEMSATVPHSVSEIILEG